jgi:hypothetical protein
MTTIQAQIIELMGKLPLPERRQLVEHMYDVNLFDESVYDHLPAEQRARLDESIAQVERGETIPSDQVFDELAKKFGFSRV